MAHPIVGLIGRKRSGKDTFAHFLTGRHRFTRYAFADPLKRAALDLDPIVGVDVLPRPWEIRPHLTRLSEVVEALGWEEAKDYTEVRRTLQALGLAMRGVDEDIWLRATMVRATAHALTRGPVVITDVRFPNEADMIEKAGGTLVRIVRPGLDTTDTHVSETALDYRDTRFEVHNDASLDHLSNAATLLATDLL